MVAKPSGIKAASEYRRGELARDVLKLIGAGVALGAAVVAPNTLQVIDHFDPKGARERKKIWRAIKYLESKNCIHLERRGTNTFLTLTDAGKARLNEEVIWDLMIKRPRRWDGKWRIVMFDLPSHHDRVRQSFRLKLEDFGFKLYQRSVFIYPYECQQEVDAVAEWYGVRDYVRYIVATEIHDMRTFAHIFDLL